jgi:ABC-2 type transport system permease protein
MGIQVNSQRVVDAGYGNVGWLAFAIIGVATANYLWMCIGRISSAMQDEIEEGTFEQIVSSLIHMKSYIIGQSIRSFLISGYYMLGVLVIGVFVLKVPLVITFETIISFLVIILMMVASYIGIGIIIAGVTIVYKKGDELTILFISITEFLGGVLFPLNYLRSYFPLWTIAWFMPYTYALDAERRILLNGETLVSPSVLKNFMFLGIFAIIFIPLGLLVFRWGYNRIRKEGTVATY